MNVFVAEDFKFVGSKKFTISAVAVGSRTNLFLYSLVVVVTIVIYSTHNTNDELVKISDLPMFSFIFLTFWS